LLAAPTQSLLEDARELSRAGRQRGAEILAGFASEEVAKIFIWLDSVRAGLADDKTLSATMPNFDDHLARRVYATTYLVSPADYAEALRFTESLRPSRELDGIAESEFKSGN